MTIFAVGVLALGAGYGAVHADRLFAESAGMESRNVGLPRAL